jgi:hypothetical protein
MGHAGYNLIRIRGRSSYRAIPKVLDLSAWSHRADRFFSGPTFGYAMEIRTNLLVKYLSNA